jgi:hypothetical protein
MAIITATAGKGDMGRDITISTVTADGLPVTITQVLEVEYRQITHDITKRLLNAHVLLADLPSHWEGTIQYVRSDGTIDKGISAIEAAWLDKDQADYKPGTMTLTVTTEAGPSTIKFLDVTLKDEGTMWKSEDVTVGKIAFRAARRQVG